MYKRQALAALLGVNELTAPPEAAMADVSVTPPERPEPGEVPEESGLAQSVRYSEEVEIPQQTRVTVDVAGRGEVHVALVARSGPVREAWVTAPGQVRFAEITPGHWALRVLAGPGAGTVRARARRGGASQPLFLLAAALLLLPLAWPHRRRPVEAWRRLTSS